MADDAPLVRRPLGRFKAIDRAPTVRQAALRFTRLGVSQSSPKGTS